MEAVGRLRALAFVNLTVFSCSAAAMSLHPSAPLKSLQLMFRRWTCGADAMMRAMWVASAEVMELWLRSTLVRFVCAATAVAALSKRALLMLLKDSFARGAWPRVERMLSKCTDISQAKRGG
jgi:hypothetical protein